MALFDIDERLQPPTSPKQFEYQVIRAQTACALNEQWHSRLPAIDWSNVVRNTHYVCFGAKYEGEFYAVAIWSSPVAQNRFKHGKQILELRRMAISPEAPRNTATQMLSFMRKHIKNNMTDIALLVSYQDTEVHFGTIYKADNWIATSVTEGTSWTTDKRIRNKDQTLADKVRWEYKIKDFYTDEVELEAGQELSTLDPQTDNTTIGRGKSTAEDRQ
jgi:hypothetical protein